MSQYHNFFGIDIGKYTFVVADLQSNHINEYENNELGVKKFIKEHKGILPISLCILETTGGYEKIVLKALCKKCYAVHKADSKKVKNFIRSYGNTAKTDNLDAKSLARYGKERVDTLELYKLPSKQEGDLFELVQRRGNLKQMLIAEKNRLQSPSLGITKQYCNEMIKFLLKQMEVITKEINLIIEKDSILRQKQQVLKGIPGIGNIIAFEILILLPELGKLNRKQIASLAGVAPKANDSGIRTGYRKTTPGRSNIKPILYLAAMAARNSKTDLKVYYERLIGKGKKKMVALTALMRKILVRANAKLKIFYTPLKHS